MGPERLKCRELQGQNKLRRIIKETPPGSKSNLNSLRFKTPKFVVTDRPQGPIFPRSKRFHTVFKHAANSCPGTYGKGGIPHAAMEAANKRPVTTIGSLDSGKSVDRAMPLFGTDLAAGRYEFKSFTEELLARQVSKRGPYDLTTGPRDGRPKKKSGLGPGHYDHQSFTDNLQKGTRQKHGKFGCMKRSAKPGERIFYSTISQCPTSVMSDNGPGSYNIRREEKGSYNRIPKPFNSSSERFNKHTDKYFKANPNECGVGRYDLRKYKPSKQGTTKHLFMSNTERFLDPKSTKYFNERIRSKDTRYVDSCERKS
jgi:hypothetical protein